MKAKILILKWGQFTYEDLLQKTKFYDLDHVAAHVQPAVLPTKQAAAQPALLFPPTSENVSYLQLQSHTHIREPF